MSTFLEAVLEDLCRFSPELLDPGTQCAVRLRGVRRGFGALGDELERAAALARLVPALTNEHEAAQGSESGLWRTTPVPLRAVLSRSPAHWDRTDGRWVPKTWLTPEFVQTADRASARWLEHLLVVMDSRLDARRTRVAKHVGDAQSIAPSTVWARADFDAQSRLLERIDEARRQLARARHENARAAGSRITPSAAPPTPYPRTPPWIALRQLSEVILDERRALQASLAGLLTGGAEVADEPYLYQRWVGLKLIEAFDDLGWSARGDVVFALYLGGSIHLVREGIEIQLHVEPRLSERMDHPCGCYCARGTEVTPDFLLVAPGPSGQDVYVLDASKTSDREVLRSKYRYLELVANVKPRRIAGVWTRHPPRRAWAAAPLDRSVCDLDRPDGTCGIVPMDPASFRREPIAAWVSDIDRDAHAWSSRVRRSGGPGLDSERAPPALDSRSGP